MNQQELAYCYVILSQELKQYFEALRVQAEYLDFLHAKIVTWNGYAGKVVITSDYRMNHYFCWYTNTSTNITRLQFTGGKANGFASGSRIEVWTRK